jgi:predicted nuclease of predicted toxin-antitoxin system
MSLKQYKWLIDTQLPPQLSKFLVQLGQDAVHTSSYEKGIFISDSEIRKIAISENRIIITKDSDFYNGHFLNTIMPPVLYLRLGNISNKELINIIINNFEKITEAIDQKSKLIILEKLNLLIF